MLRRSLLGFAVHAISSRAHRARMRVTSTMGWCTVPALYLTRANSVATRTPSWISSIRRRPESHGGSIITNRPFLLPRITRTSSLASRIRECAARKFFDPNYTSCTSFLAHIAQTRYNFDTAPVAELIHWADIVDGAKYESPEAAVEMAAPAMKLTLIIESTQDPGFIPRLIPLLTELPLAEILRQPFVAPLLSPLLERHRQALELIRGRAEERDGHDLLRHHRPSPGRIQQIHPILPVSERNLFDRFVEVEFPHQGRRRIESVDKGRSRKDGEPGADLRALRRGRARARGSHQLSAGRGSRRASRQPRRLLPNCVAGTGLGTRARTRRVEAVVLCDDPISLRLRNDAARLRAGESCAAGGETAAGG